MTVMMSFLLSEPDPRGNWKLSGLSVDYLHIARETTPFYLTVDYPELSETAFATSSDCAVRNADGEWVDNPNKQSICVHLQDVPAGVMFNRLTNGPFTNQGLGGIGVNLNVNIYDGGNGTIAQGSFYPDIELSESQACVTDLQIFAVNENFSWEVGPQTTFSESNVLGMENGLLCTTDDPNTPTVGNECPENTDEAWGFGLVTGLFDETPAEPVPVRIPPGLPYVALTDNTVLAYSCKTAITSQACGTLGYNLALGQYLGGDCPTDDCTADCIAALGAGALTLQEDILACEGAPYEYAPADGIGGKVGWLKGTGTSSKFNLGTNMVDSDGNPTNQSSMCVDNAGNPIPGDGTCNPDVDFKLVWHALDSQETGLGFGDIDFPADGWDEDGDGSEFDRIFGVPYISVTKLNPLGATLGPLCDISKGMAQYVDSTSTNHMNPNYYVNYPLAGDIVAALGEDCDEATYDAQYDCGADEIASFITGSCNDTVSNGIIAACTGAGDPSTFATGFCMGQIEDNLDGCSAVGWQAIVGGVCNGLGVDCSSNLGAAQAMFDQICAGAAAVNPNLSGLGISTCAELVSYTGQDQDVLECGFLAENFLIDSNNDGYDDLPFYVGACSTVAGGVVGSIDTDGDGTTDTCSEWVATFGQDAIDSFAQPSLGGLTCTYYGDNFVSECLETAGEYNADNDTEMYLFQPGEGLHHWGDFMTYNAAVFASLAAQAGSPNDQGTGLSVIPCGVDENGNPVYSSFPMDDLTEDDDTNAALIAGFTGNCNPHLMVNDSSHDFDTSCFTDDDLDCSGRLRMTFEPTCVPEIEARQIVAEFVDLTTLCTANGDVDYSCTAYDWNYDYQADCNSDIEGSPACITETGDGDGTVTQAECQAYADATEQTFVIDPVLPQAYGGTGILPSCDEDEGITTNCTSYSATVVWYSNYGFCGDGDPNDLIDLGPDGFCAKAMAATDVNGDPDPVFPSMEYCLGAYAQQGGIPNFEQSCQVGDGSVTVTDVVRIINHIIGEDSTFGESVDQLGGEAACNADINADGAINVVDVVAIVNGILAGGRVADATEASISTENNKISVISDGFIGAVDMIVEFSDNSSFDIADGFASRSRVVGNKAHIILIGDKEGISDVLTMTSGKIVNIIEVLVANSSDFVTTSINQPSIFSVGAAYPNPFNPSTNISLDLNANADLSVKVYNLTGQLVDVIAEGNFSPSSYNWTWKAENLASGVYFIKTQVGSEVSTQKVMLLK